MIFALSRFYHTKVSALLDDVNSKYILKDTIMSLKSPFSFQRGFMEAKGKDQPVIRRKLLELLNIEKCTRQTWNNHLMGRVRYDRVRAAEIEAVFAEFNIYEIWGGLNDGK